MFHKSHARGDTWDCFATPGLSTDLLDSKAGISLKSIFRLGILNGMAIAKDANSTTNNINLTTHPFTNDGDVNTAHTNALPTVTLTDANNHTNTGTNTQPSSNMSSDDITDTNSISGMKSFNTTKTSSTNANVGDNTCTRSTVLITFTLTVAALALAMKLQQ